MWFNVLLHSQTHRLGDTVEVRDAVTVYQVHKAVLMSVHITTFIVHTVIVTFIACNCGNIVAMLSIGI